MQATFKIQRDDTLPAFGGWKAGSLKRGEPVILLNVDVILQSCLDECDPYDPKVPADDVKYMLVGTLVHEFGHALQEFFDLEFDEAKIEEIVDTYFGHELMPREEYLKLLKED